MEARDAGAVAAARASGEQLRSRRGLLGGGLAALSGLYAVFGGARDARAATGDNAKVGEVNNGGPTTFRSTGLSALIGQNQGSTANANGVFGRSESTTGRGVLGIAGAASGATSGVLGQALSGTGVGVRGIAPSPNGVGVLGTAPIGVRGTSAAPAGRGVLGAATATTGPALGVFGYSESTAGTAVQGDARATSGLNYGVVGSAQSPDGVAVEGRARALTGEAVGVHGFSQSVDGVGVQGVAQAGNGWGVFGVGGPTGVGGYFRAAEGQPGAVGLAVHGRAEFSTCGVATIANGANQVVVTPGVEITSNTKVLATLQSDSASGAVVSSAAPNVGANTITIRLNGPSASTCTVAWFVIG